MNVVAVKERVQRYRVVSVLAIVPDETQGQVYLNRDQLLPIGLPAEIVAHLLDTHCVVPVAE
jgi:hypothetical protein